MSTPAAVTRAKCRSVVDKLRSLHGYDLVICGNESGFGMTFFVRDYSPTAHAAEFDRMRRRLAAIADPVDAVRFANLLDLVDPGMARAGVRVPFDVPVRETMPHSIKFLPNLTAPAWIQFRDGKSMDAFILDASGGTLLRSGVLWLNGQIVFSDIQSVGPYRQVGAHWLAERLPASSYDPISETAIVEFDEPEYLDDRFVYLLLDARLARSNFAHFVHDLLYQLPVIDRMIAEFGDALKLICAGHPKPVGFFSFPIQHFIMERLGLADRIVDVNGRTVRFARGYVASRPMSIDGIPHTYSARYCKHRLRKALDIDSRMATGPIYFIDRREKNVDPRLHVNSDEVRAVLQSYGVVPIVVGALDAPDIVEVFSEAGGVVGMGAGLLNIIFADESAPFIELARAPDVWDSLRNAALAWRHPVARISWLPGSANVLDCEALSNELARLIGRR